MVDPVFLLGPEPAGALLIGVALSSHDEVHWAGDFDWALDWPDHQPGEWPPLIPYWQRIALSQRARELRARIDPSLGFAALVRTMLEQQCAARRGLHVLSAGSRYASLLALWPRARFVYVHRAGDDPHQRQAAREWRGVAAEISPGARYELRYEALVSAPAVEIARVCEFLGIAYSEALLRHPHTLDARLRNDPLTRGALAQRLGAATKSALVHARNLRTRSIAALRSLASNREHLGREANPRVEQPHDAVEAQRSGDETVAARVALELRDPQAQNAGAVPQAVAHREQPGELGARVVFGTGGVRHVHALRNPRPRSASSTASEISRVPCQARTFVENRDEIVEKS